LWPHEITFSPIQWGVGLIVDITKWAQAAYLHYNGLTMSACLTSGYASTTWKFEVPTHDWEIIQQEMKDAQQSIYMLAFLQSIKAVQHAQKQSRQSFGVWSVKGRPWQSK
jgi:hypothetical protein